MKTLRNKYQYMYIKLTIHGHFFFSVKKNIEKNIELIFRKYIKNTLEKY